jgi:hypothetical protein
MDTQTVKASENPGLANELVNKALNTPVQEEKPEVQIKTPSDTLVDLPGGYVSPTGEVIRTAEVRELNGRDEEVIAKTTTVGRVLNTILSRGVVSIGGTPATEAMLDSLFSGDRDALLLGIYRATFGNPAELKAYCRGCEDVKDVAVDLIADITSKVLADPVTDREFTVEGKGHTYKVVLPTGHVQKELNNNPDKTIAELGSILLQNTVISIDENVVYDKSQVLNIGLQDRRKIGTEIGERNPGPRFDDITVTCPDCESEVVVPISLGALFQF